MVGVTNDKCRFFLGKDYSNSYKKDFQSVERFDEGSKIFFFLVVFKRIIIFFQIISIEKVHHECHGMMKH
jgi:hypothetical protein